MKELVEFMARGLVDEPDAVEVEEEEDGDYLVYHLYVADDDMGKVIGRQGRIANAMRSLLKAAASRSGVRVSLDIGD
ncbi:MAG: KH domain-containing protein [Chloroflexi bacterium]|nr:KH domain-containing protein [Chloroflexota bacterium]